MPVPPPLAPLRPSPSDRSAASTAEDAQKAGGAWKLWQRRPQKGRSAVVAASSARADSPWSEVDHTSAFSGPPASLDGPSTMDRQAATPSTKAPAHEPQGRGLPGGVAQKPERGDRAGPVIAVSAPGDIAPSRTPPFEGRGSRPNIPRDNSGNSGLSLPPSSVRHLPAMGTVPELSDEGGITPISTRSDPMPSQQHDNPERDSATPRRGHA